MAIALGIDCFHCACLLLAITSALLLLHLNQPTYENENAPSSVWCNEHTEGLQCSFQNLYYHPEEHFIFFLTPQSIVSGLRDPSQLNQIQTSTVANHSAFYLKIETRIKFSGARAESVQRKLFLLQRFKPDNLLHAIHDDLIPLHATYRRLCFGNVDDCTREYQLALIDQHEEGPFFDWYTLFSDRSPMLFSELVRKWYRFCDVKIGLLNKIVYQYGMGRVHGPVKSELRGEDISGFTGFILRKYGIGRNVSGFTLVCRRHTRQILNENYVINLVESNLKPYGNFQTNVIDLSANNTSEVIEAVSSSSLLIAMHGAESILALLLPRNSSFIELFPYGIDKRFVSPVLSYSLVQDIHFRYFSWTNSNESHTVTHPTNPPIFGGIRHLNEALQREIEATPAVPPVACCHDPLYLYRMFQDTLVDRTVEPVIAAAIDSIQPPRIETSENEIDYTRWFVPGEVMNLRCQLSGNHAVLKWDAPKNMIHFEDARFHVVLKDNHRSEMFRTKLNSFTLKLNKKDTFFEAWVSSELFGVTGRDSYVQCNK